MKPIEDYAIIGDGRSTALVSREGSIDWLCWPRLDGASIFASLLDDQAGSWSIRPAGPHRTTRRYLEHTNILETRFETSDGVVRLTDLMPVASEEDKSASLVPEHEILRRIECDRGDVELDIDFNPRPNFGRTRPRFRPAGRLGLRCEWGASVLYLHSGLEWTLDGRASTRVRMRAGQSVSLSLTLACEEPAVIPLAGPDRIGRSVDWWRRWVARCRYQGPAREAVIRSALVLKLLSYAPSGAMIAAPTTSLPERIGGDFNWDYRFCWLRDASMTARALFGLGYHDEGDAFVSWLLHSTRLSRRTLRILYDVFGRKPPRERTLDHLSGYRGSRPVRVGNAAMDQLQLDVYGEVLEAVAHFVDSGGDVDRETAGMVMKFGRIVCARWNEPDEGIWEPRTGRSHHTHSRLMCWVALDRLLSLAARGHLPGAPVDDYRRERDEIAEDIRTRGWNESSGSYVGTLDGDDLDTAVLGIPRYGFEEAGSDRMQRTYERLRSNLGAGPSLLFRNAGVPGEGAFGVSSFWGAEYLALGGGGIDEAERAVDELLSHANDLGLFAEEIDPQSGAALGNFPQAYTHIGMINTALTLDRRKRGAPAEARR